MSGELWRLDAIAIASGVRTKEFSAREVTEGVLDRIDATNPRINALAEVMRDEALASANEADQRSARGDAPGPLHGVPITVKVNVDTEGHATTEGCVALAGHLASSDSPVVSNLRVAGAIIVGRSNTPAFSLRWFTDNDIHGRTLNPFDPTVTPGGSSGGAAAAVATGMGAIGHGNDYGGSIRYPAFACGVVGLRTTAGRIPSYKATSPNRTITNQLMSVQGPLTRTVADARVALQVMSRPSALDPNWSPAPLEYEDRNAKESAKLKVALFKHDENYRADKSVGTALDQAAQWLEDAGCIVEEAEPPHFKEASDLWRQMVYDDLRRTGLAAFEKMGDASVKRSLALSFEGVPEFDRDGYLEALTRRLGIMRDWSVFFQRYPVLLMPNSWERQFPIDDDIRSQPRSNELVMAQSPLLCTALMGLPGLSVPVAMDRGLPTGVQLVSWRYREDLVLRAGEMIEHASQFSALNLLAP
jgi:amidase